MAAAGSGAARSLVLAAARAAAASRATLRRLRAAGCAGRGQRGKRKQRYRQKGEHSRFHDEFPLCVIGNAMRFGAQDCADTRRGLNPQVVFQAKDRDSKTRPAVQLAKRSSQCRFGSEPLNPCAVPRRCFIDSPPLRPLKGLLFAPHRRAARALMPWGRAAWHIRMFALHRWHRRRIHRQSCQPYNGESQNHRSANAAIVQDAHSTKLRQLQSSESDACHSAGGTRIIRSALCGRTERMICGVITIASSE